MRKVLHLVGKPCEVYHAPFGARLYKEKYTVFQPDSKTVSVYVLKNGEYTAMAYGESDAAKFHVLDGCEIFYPICSQNKR